MKFRILSCELYPQGNADLQLLKSTLIKNGDFCEISPWQEFINFSQDEILLPLAAWDYSQNFSEFLAFLDRVEKENLNILNSTKIIRQNISKNYLIMLLNHDISVIPTEIYNGKIPWQDSVIKPLVGQSGRGVQRIKMGQNLDEILAQNEFENAAIIQPFVSEILTNGEICLVFFNGKFAYAIKRKPAPNEYRANSNFGVKTQTIKVSENFINIAKKALGVFGEIPLYARVDLVPIDEQKALINEVEMIEPALYFGLVQGSVDEFCHAIKSRF